MTNDLLSLLSKITQIRVVHRQLLSAIEGIKKCVALAAAVQPAPCAVLAGTAGVGKSSLCAKLVQDYAMPPERTAGLISNKVGAFYVQIPSPASISSLASEILEKLGDPHPLRGNARSKTKRIVRLLKASCTRLILLDEFHHLFAADAGGKTTTLDNVRNWLKTLIDECGVPIVLIGMPECEALVNGEPQLSRRFPYRFRLGNLPLTDGTVAPFQQFIATFAAEARTVCQISAIPAFNSRDEALRAYVATRGNPDAVAKLFFFAIERAVSAGVPVSMGHFAQAADEPFLVTLRLTDQNPFGMDVQAIHTALALHIQKAA